MLMTRAVLNLCSDVFVSHMSCVFVLICFFCKTDETQRLETHRYDQPAGVSFGVGYKKPTSRVTRLEYEGISQI